MFESLGFVASSFLSARVSPYIVLGGMIGLILYCLYMLRDFKLRQISIVAFHGGATGTETEQEREFSTVFVEESTSRPEAGLELSGRDMFPLAVAPTPLVAPRSPMHPASFHSNLRSPGSRASPSVRPTPYMSAAMVSVPSVLAPEMMGIELPPSAITELALTTGEIRTSPHMEPMFNSYSSGLDLRTLSPSHSMSTFTDEENPQVHQTAFSNMPTPGLGVFGQLSLGRSAVESAPVDPEPQDSGLASIPEGSYTPEEVFTMHPTQVVQAP